MFDVEAKIAFQANPFVDNIESWSSEWEDVYNVPQLESDAAEYERAKEFAKLFRETYKHVRIVKWVGGNRQVVTECPFTQSHTREWCGYPECRES